MNVHEVHTKFKSERECHNYLIQIRWPNGVFCPHCNQKAVYRRSWELGFKCRTCNSSFTVTAGTMFHSTKLPLSKWFMAISIILSAKKGISSLQLSRTINVNKNTAWYMQKRIRESMKTDLILNGIVEIDDTYIGGALGNMTPNYKRKRNPYKSGMVHKLPVLGMYETGSGKVRLDKIQHACGEIIKPLVKAKISKQSEIVTDGFGGYFGLDKHFLKQTKMNHEKKIRQIERYSLSHIEGLFSTIKRAIIGQYHSLSSEHLQSYMDEIAFKKNFSNSNSFELLLIKACARI
jgi:transposase-like protein